MTADIEHHRVTANGVDFHVAVSGPEDAPAALCLHGFPEGWMTWRPVMQRLPHLRLYAPDLRGYGESGRPRRGYDVFTLTDDIAALIEVLGLQQPVLVCHDWGGALGWIVAHRSPQLIRRLLVANCPHPRTLVRAIVGFEDFQTFRVPWVPVFEIPWLPEWFLTTALGRFGLKLSFTLREGQLGMMDVSLVDEMVGRFRRTADMRPPIQWYREMVCTQLVRQRRDALHALYDNPIPVPVTLVWATDDGALSARVALESTLDAGCEVEFRPLPGIGHFISLEAPDLLADEVERVVVA